LLLSKAVSAAGLPVNATPAIRGLRQYLLRAVFFSSSPDRSAFDLLGVRVNLVDEFPGVILEMPAALFGIVANAGVRFDRGYSAGAAPDQM
jgi:hypothetical protein